jgi:hypothetical protein
MSRPKKDKLQSQNNPLEIEGQDGGKDEATSEDVAYVDSVLGNSVLDAVALEQEQPELKVATVLKDFNYAVNGRLVCLKNGVKIYDKRIIKMLLDCKAPISA